MVCPGRLCDILINFVIFALLILMLYWVRYPGLGVEVILDFCEVRVVSAEQGFRTEF